MQGTWHHPGAEGVWLLLPSLFSATRHPHTEAEVPWGTEVVKNHPHSPVRAHFPHDSEDMPQPTTLYGEGMRGRLTDRTEYSQPEIGVAIPEGSAEEMPFDDTLASPLLPWAPAVSCSPSSEPPALTLTGPSLPSFSGFLPWLAKPFSDPLPSCVLGAAL